MIGALHKAAAIIAYVVLFFIPFAAAVLILGWREGRRRLQEQAVFRDATHEFYLAYKTRERRRAWLRGAAALVTFVIISILIDVILRDAAKIGALISDQHRGIFH